MLSVSDLVAALWIGLSFLALLGAAELWRWLGNPPVEWTRKLVHSAGGIVCLMLPFFVRSPWVVLALALGMGAIFLVSHRMGWLSSVHGVRRSSRGTEYYPLVVCLLFFLAHDRPWLYCICILVLAVSDTMAALVGTRYGSIHYEVEDEHKSLEGSLAFMVVTFLAVQLPLVLWPEPSLPPPANCVLAALLLALLVTGFEAISLHGRDNLWIPFGTYVVLVKALRQPPSEIVFQIVTLVAICLAVAIAAWRAKAMNVGGALTMILCAYGCWSLGSIDWALPMFAGFAFHLVARYFTRDESVAKVRTVVQCLLVPFLLIAVANLAWISGSTENYSRLFGPFLASCVAMLQQVTWNQISSSRPPTAGRMFLAASAVWALCCAAIVGPVWLRQRDVPVAAPFWIGMVTVGCVWMQVWYLAQPARVAVIKRWWIGRHLLSVAAAAVIWIAQSTDLSPLWRPS